MIKIGQPEEILQKQLYSKGKYILLGKFKVTVIWPVWHIENPL